MSMGNNVQVCLSGTSMNQHLVVVTQCLKERSDIGHFPTEIAGCLNNFGFGRTKWPSQLS